jgi:hypothetical protein
MHRPTARWVFAIGLAIASASPALAQFGVANLSHADGLVTRLRSSAPIAAVAGDSLIEGEQVATAGGRAEVTFLDGAIAHLDRDTRIVLTTGDGFRLLHGRASLRTAGSREYVAETAAARVFVPAGSLVEISVRAEADGLLQVISGVARIETAAAGAQRVNDYYTASVSGPGRAPVVARVASTPTDDFGRWTLARTVMATSVALKGSEQDGGVSSTTYYTSPPASSSYYGSSYYQAPSYGSYYPTSYYTPYYSGAYYPQPYYGTPYSYYNAYSYSNSYRSLGYGSYRSPGHLRRGPDFPRPVQPIARPPVVRPAHGMRLGALAAVPRR